MWTKIFLTIFLIKTISAADNIINLPNGAIRGQVLQTVSGAQYQAFQGVPYAKPPVGELRFKNPQPTEKWDGILDTITDTRCCMQLYSTPANQSEDCLYMNIYVPQDTNQTDLPVMMYIHGGGFREGNADNTSSGPDYFIEDGVILITITYRLNIFGFLSTQDMVSPGNIGIKDCVMALKWVHDNINFFGGDPDKITIFGESAGGSAVSYLVLSKQSQGLFRAAIHESGTTLNMFNFQKYHKDIAYEVAAVVDESYTTDKTTQEIYDLFRNSSTEALLSATRTVTGRYPDNTFKNIQYGHLFSGAIEPEHEDAIITDHFYEVFVSQNGSKIPQIFGINSEEYAGYSGDLNGFINVLKLYDSNYSALVPISLNVNNSVDRNELGTIIKEMYAGNGTFADNPAAGIRFGSDMWINKGVIKAAELTSNYADVYFYVFSYSGPLGHSDFNVKGIAHGAELFYLLGRSGVLLADYPESDVLTLRRMVRMWTNFAKYLNPTPENDTLLADATWPTARSEGNDRFLYLDIGSDLVVKENPKRDTMDKWDELYDKYGNRPYDTY